VPELATTLAMNLRCLLLGSERTQAAGSVRKIRQINLPDLTRAKAFA
jgi:hypothetical protein